MDWIAGNSLFKSSPYTRQQQQSIMHAEHVSTQKSAGDTHVLPDIIISKFSLCGLWKLLLRFLHSAHIPSGIISSVYNFQRPHKLNLEIMMSGKTCVSPADFWVLTCLMISSIMVAFEVCWRFII
jgi:hypothetical protein